MKALYVLLVVLLLGFGNPSVDGCSCMPEHPQTLFCKSSTHFVVKATVKTKTVVHSKDIVKDGSGTKVVRYPFQHIYKIRITKTFKENDLFRNATKTRLYTASSEAMCGSSLKNYTKYLLSGYVVNGRLHVNMCNLVREWQQMTIRMKKGVYYLYKRNCKCQVSSRLRPCEGPSCKTVNPNTCQWSYFQDIGHCLFEHNLCVARSSGKCRWGKSHYVRACQEQARLEP